MRSIKKSKQNISKNKAKGNLVEDIVKMMHQAKGIEVIAPAYLDGKGKRTRKREIDVLIVGFIAGYQIKIAIECKNEKLPIGSPKIDAFRGKLLDIGIHEGVFVSASGYTQDAIEVAKEAGIKTLTLKGLTPDSLQSVIYQAIQNVIFLLPIVVAWSVTNTLSGSFSINDATSFYDSEGKRVYSVFDMFWEYWMSDRIPSSPGEYEFTIDVPEAWHQELNGEIVRTSEISAKIIVKALMIQIPGTARQHHLIDAATQITDKVKIGITFDTTPNIYTVLHFETKEELDKYLNDVKYTFSVTLEMQKLPRLAIQSLYWPPSQKALNRIKEITAPFIAGLAPDPNPIKFEDIEGTDLSSVFDPIIEAHPIAKMLKSLQENKINEFKIM